MGVSCPLRCAPKMVRFGCYTCLIPSRADKNSRRVVKAASTPLERRKKGKRNGRRLLARSEQFLKIALQRFALFSVDHCKRNTHQGCIGSRLLGLVGALAKTFPGSLSIGHAIRCSG